MGWLRKIARILAGGYPHKIEDVATEMTIMQGGKPRSFVRADRNSPWLPTGPNHPPRPSAIPDGIRKPDDNQILWGEDRLDPATGLFADAHREADMAAVETAGTAVIDPKTFDGLRYFVWRIGGRGPTASLERYNPTGALDWDTKKQ